LKVDVVRDRTSLARLVDEGRIENLYRIQLMNATERPQRYRIAAQGMADIDLPGGIGPIEVASAQARWVVVAARVPPESARAAGPGAHPIQFRIENIEDPAVAVTEKSTFIVPR